MFAALRLRSFCNLNFTQHGPFHRRKAFILAAIAFVVLSQLSADSKHDQQSFDTY
ncbi:MAG: hypothetical protein Fues2KO_08230 [Fuerstiella sp.]